MATKIALGRWSEADGAQPELPDTVLFFVRRSAWWLRSVGDQVSAYEDPLTPFMYHCHLMWHEDVGMMAQSPSSIAIRWTRRRGTSKSIKITSRPAMITADGI